MFHLKKNDIHGRASHASIEIDEKIYIIGGETWNKEEHCEIYR